MYYCKYCGLTSQFNSCNNSNCKNFNNIMINCSCKNKLFCNNQENNYQPAIKWDSVDPQLRQEYMRDNNMNQMTEMNPDMKNSEGIYMRDMNKKDTYMPDMNKKDEYMPEMKKDAYMPEMSKCKMPQVPCNDQLPLAFATVPFQKFQNMYPLDKALMSGTVFPELDMPYKKRI